MPRAAAVPVLTYHAMNVAGRDYPDNEHIAFAQDLERLHALGVRVVPLAHVVEALRADRLDSLRGALALTLDDGADFDAYDLPHPYWGLQRGMLGILRDFRARHGERAQPGLHATSFAIVSPEARLALDRTSMIGCRWWNDGWWSEAEASGLMSVENHSWDHNHASLERTVAGAPRGAFAITTREDADAEIAQASRWLRARRGRQGAVLFAYPYGPASDYLANEYFPDASAGHGVEAAFTTDGAPVTRGSSPWRLPRFVFGWHWKSANELEKLLSGCGAIPRRAGFLRGLTARHRPRMRASTPPAPRRSWRDCLRTWEVNDPRVVAASLLEAGEGSADLRHFVLIYSPLPAAADPVPRVVAYLGLGQRASHAQHGARVDRAVERVLPAWLLQAAQEEQGLAAILERDALAAAERSPRPR